MSKHTLPEFKLFLNYLVSRNGYVIGGWTNWRGIKERRMSEYPNKYGYLRVRLKNPDTKKRKSYMVHILVCDLFNGPKPSPKHQVCHLDGNKKNNSAKNLIWGTAKDNAQHREKHGRTSRGIGHSLAIKKSCHKLKVKRGSDHYLSILKKARG